MLDKRDTGINTIVFLISLLKYMLQVLTESASLMLLMSTILYLFMEKYKIKEAFIMLIHKICFHGEMRKISVLFVKCLI